MINQISVEEIAELCHEVNRAYCQGIGDNSQPSWKDLDGGLKTSAIAGVEDHLRGYLTPEQSHENWLAFKVAKGWKYGPVKDVEKKEHPCMVPYDQLPEDQKVKDFLFKAVVDFFKTE